VLPYNRFSNCFLNYDYVLHIVNFAILYNVVVRLPFESILSKTYRYEADMIQMDKMIIVDVSFFFILANIYVLCFTYIVRCILTTNGYNDYC
jgi:hypothetical protein